MPIIRFSNYNFDMNILRHKFCTKHKLDALKMDLETSCLSFSKVLAA
jgi:hypothetical protein